ncbi:uncharacterized protein LOC125262605 [Megalobrama amblycephala]|uniref:uncharacterized protein LOC125262605 n=1 Tax=Megalobrama amblycephala TaxID=75352 RepID=UPI002013F0C9|nr:uncharacterized protein LOC125262605 [Megalobrama amblycephala]
MYRNMEMFVVFFVLLLVDGVVGVTDEIQSVSVMEGESVTLYCDVTEIQKADRILWTFGPDSTRIAQINRSVNKISLYNDVLDGRFRDRLHLDKTGSLTITNPTTELAGLYKLQLIGGKEVPPKKFSIIVSARLPVPVISTNCPLSSSSSSPGLSAGEIALVCVCALAVAAGLCGFYYYHQRKTSKQGQENGGTFNKDRYSQKGAVPLLVVKLDAYRACCREAD